MKRLNTLFTGQRRLYFDQIPSTNEYAVELLSKSRPPEGTAIIAACQSAGRGQFGSRWESEAGKNLTLSVIYYPSFLAPQRQFLLSQAMALAVLDLVDKWLKSAVFIKWPNDIYAGSKKIAGILIQNALRGINFEYSVVGVGVNIHQEVFASGIPNPTSFYLESGRFFDMQAVENSLLSCMEKRYLQLRTGQTEALRKEYLQHLYRLGVRANYQKTDGTILHGILTGVDEAGRLIVKNSDGENHFDLKEIRFLHDP